MRPDRKTLCDDAGGGKNGRAPDDLCKPVFEGTGGSALVLSPLGNKGMAPEALMAAPERNLPVAHPEAIGYEFDVPEGAVAGRSEIVRVWLEGDACPQSRPALEA